MFPVRETDAMQGGLNANGVRVRTGYMDEDGTGWMMSGFYSAETDISFRRGQRRIGGTEIDQVIIAAYPLLIYTRNGAVPLVDARDWQDSAIGFPTFNGTTQKYDILFHQDFNTTSAGADLNHYLAQLYRSKNIQVSSFIGGRYFYLGEHFRFMGVDSGFGYDVSIDEDDATFGPEGALTLAYPLLESRLLSHVESHMAGPQIGLRVDIGKKKNLHIWTQSIFGLLANYEQLTVSGNNIGDPLLHPEMFDQVSFTYFDNSFKEKKTHTHVSPMLEQSFFADIRLPHLIPVLSKSFLTENASLRLGYTWTYIGAVSRPTHSISWKGFPLTPGVKIDRQDFDMNTLSVGITCPF